jgi:hypothetical protein
MVTDKVEKFSHYENVMFFRNVGRIPDRQTEQFFITIAVGNVQLMLAQLFLKN